MKLKVILVLIVLGLIVALPTVSHAKQVLLNPSFEKGWDSWTVSYNQHNWSPLDLPGDKKALRCWWDGGMRQLVPVTAGKAYEFKGDVFVAAGGDKDSWGCWVSFDWYDSNRNKIGTAWTVSPQEDERNKWLTYDSGKQTAPKGSAFACISFGVYQNNCKPANPVDFANFSLEEIE